MTKTNDHQAFNQWLHRPYDERFEDIESLEANAKASMMNCRQLNAVISGFHMEAVDDTGLLLCGKEGQRAELSYLASRQLATRLKIPNGIFDANEEGEARFGAKALANLVNDRIRRCNDDTPVQMYAEQTGNKDVPWDIKCVTTEKYNRVHDYYVIQGIKALMAEGWKVPPARPVSQDQPGSRPATEEDILKFGSKPGLSIKVGDPIAPAGLCRGDQDMFCILVNDQNPIDDGSGRPLLETICITNSEVGQGSFSRKRIIHDDICSNLIIWGVKESVELRYRHVGDVFNRIMNTFKMDMKSRDFTDDLRMLKWMRENRLGTTTKEVVEKVYDMNLGQSITKRLLTTALSGAERFRGIDADPFSYAGMFQAVTRTSQLSRNANQRFAIDREIGGLMTIAQKELATA